MQWTLISSRNSSRYSTKFALPFMRRVLWCLLASVGLLVCSSRAADGPLIRDPSAFSNSVNRLALSLAKGDPVRAVDYAERLFELFVYSVFPDDVGNTPVLVFPVDSYGNTYESLFWSAVYDSAFDWGNSSLPDKSDSFLFKIYTALTNGSISGASSDMSFTNDIVSIRDILTDFSSDFLDVKSDVSLIEEWSQYSQMDIAAIRTLLESGSFSTSGITNVLLQLLESAETYRDTFDYFTGLNNVGENGIHLPDFAYDSGQYRQWRAHLDETQIASLLSALARVEDASTNTTAWGENYQSAITTMLSEIQDGLDDINDYLFEINEDVDDIHNVDLDYEGTQRSVRRDFGYWQYGSERSVASDFLRVLSAFASVSNEVASSPENDYNAARAIADFSSTTAVLEAAANAQLLETQNTMDDSSDTEPDFGSGLVGNPYDPIGDAIDAFKTSVEDKLPDFNNVSGSEVIEIFKADTGLPMDAAGVVRVNLREEMGQWVNTCGNVMSWFWNIVNSVLTIVLVARAFREIGNSI